MTNINIESLAIDPRNDNVVYAGSWHLPFKTTDGGQTWRVTNNGIIDDSDVFAIDINERDADHIIASACSGIYETKNARRNVEEDSGHSVTVAPDARDSAASDYPGSGLCRHD